MGCVKSEVLLFPPALSKTVLASSNMKWAEASDGWLGTEGYNRLFLKRLTLLPLQGPSPLRLKGEPPLFSVPLISGIEAC